jgi:type I restriction enzyme R subunit
LTAPYSPYKFTEEYIVQQLKSNQIDKTARVCISTIQRLYSMLKGEEIDPELEEESLFDHSDLFKETLCIPGKASSGCGSGEY